MIFVSYFMSSYYDANNKNAYLVNIIETNA